MNLKIDDSYYKYYILIFILSIIFYLISYRDIKVLLSLIIILIIGFYLFNYIKNQYSEIEKKKIINITNFDNNIKNRNETISNNYYINKIIKNNKYLSTNNDMINILLNIEFIKKFDNAKFTDIINYMNHYNKIYIFILSDRYKPEEYFQILLDTHYLILETLYSLFIIIPKEFKYIFGLNSYDEIYKSINDFNFLSIKMINIIELYSKKNKNVNYLIDSKIRPYNMSSDNNLP